MKTLVLGIGNLLLRDEGVGVHAARALQREALPAGVEVMEVGTSILDAIPALERADRLVVLDAVKGGREPGTVYRLRLAQCASNPCIASMHGFDLSRVLALTRNGNRPVVELVGVEPASIEWSMDLSERVAGVMPLFLETVRRTLHTTEEPAVREVAGPGADPRRGDPGELGALGGSLPDRGVAPQADLRRSPSRGPAR